MGISEPEAKGSISTRLQTATTELRELEQLIKSAEFDPRLLRNFRSAVDHVRTTAWAVQQWIELRERRGDPYAVLPVLAAERVRRMAQLARDLGVDLEAFEVSIETEGLGELFQAVGTLHERLTNLFK